MSEIFHGFELLLLRRFQLNPELWYEWRDKILDKVGEKGGSRLDELEDLGEMPQSLWFLSVTIHRRQRYLIQLMREEAEREREKRLPKCGETLLSRYLSSHGFSELYLDSMFKYGDDNRLPREYNSLDSLPSDIGRMQKLEYLALTNNKLQVRSIPHTLVFCRSLHTLLLDNNLLDALPGFLLQMPSIRTVHRHGNHNYFKSTFMWYHTDVYYRIIPVMGYPSPPIPFKEQTLQFWAAKAIIGSKKDFFSDIAIAPVLKDYIADIYPLFNVCHNCNRATLGNTFGYKVITFKNPYLGNTCVPFQHWACSIDCAKALEIPARIEQIAAAQELDRQYEEYVLECHRKFYTTNRSRVLSCRSGSPEGGAPQNPREVQLKRAAVATQTVGVVPEDATRRGCECVVS
ncbi:hypothetical protein BaRGS_00029274 [Batillaria attramentaria]|uniref:Uncharacterized protein n=1 Tax=Batillaria attramentaria TaxID=370345 RepID=A0ABD0JY72_9CAEN